MLGAEDSRGRRLLILWLYGPKAETAMYRFDWPMVLRASFIILAAFAPLSRSAGVTWADDPLDGTASNLKADRELLLALKKQRLAAVKRHIDAVVARYEAGSRADDTALLLAAHDEIVDAELDLAAIPRERVDVLAKNAALAIATEQHTLAMAEAAYGPNRPDVMAAKCRRIKAQVLLLAECIAAELPSPRWPLLPKGSPEAEVAKWIDDIDGDYVMFDIADADLTGESVIRNTPSLKAVYLSGEKVDDDAVLRLRSLKQLCRLNLRDTKVTDAGIAALKEALPTLSIDVQVTPAPLAPPQKTSGGKTDK